MLNLLLLGSSQFSLAQARRKVLFMKIMKKVSFAISLLLAMLAPAAFGLAYAGVVQMPPSAMSDDLNKDIRVADFSGLDAAMKGEVGKNARLVKHRDMPKGLTIQTAASPVTCTADSSGKLLQNICYPMSVEVIEESSSKVATGQQ